MQEFQPKDQAQLSSRIASLFYPKLSLFEHNPARIEEPFSTVDKEPAVERFNHGEVGVSHHDSINPFSRDDLLRNVAIDSFCLLGIEGAEAAFATDPKGDGHSQVRMEQFPEPVAQTVGEHSL